MLRVLLADDDPIYRQGLQALLTERADVDLVAVVPNGASALSVLERSEVDVALLDVDMPGVDGISAARQIGERHPEVTVVMLTAFEHDESLKQAIAAGAKGFLTKDLEVDRICALAREAAAGAVVMGPRPTAMLAEAYFASTEVDEEFARTLSELPPRLGALVEYLIEACPNREIAQRLGLSEATVRGYVSEILAATGCASRSQLAVRALRAGYSA